MEIFEKRNFSGQTLDFLPGDQVFIYHVRAFSSLSIMNIEMPSLILNFLSLEYFENLCNFIWKLFKKLTPKVHKQVSKWINKWEDQKFLKPIFFSIHVMLIYPTEYNRRRIVPSFSYLSK